MSNGKPDFIAPVKHKYQTTHVRPGGTNVGCARCVASVTPVMKMSTPTHVSHLVRPERPYPGTA